MTLKIVEIKNLPTEDEQVNQLHEEDLPMKTLDIPEQNE
jgi:hypothetical protein